MIYVVKNNTFTGTIYQELTDIVIEWFILNSFGYIDTKDKIDITKELTEEEKEQVIYL